MHKNKQKGFGIVETLLIVVVIGLIAGASWYTLSAIKDNRKDSQSVTEQTSKLSETPNITAPKTPRTYGSVDSESVYTQKDNKFRIQLPRSWKFVTTNVDDRIWAYCIADGIQTTNCPVEQNNAATLQLLTTSGPTYSYGLDIWYIDIDKNRPESMAPMGEKVGEVYGKNKTGSKYVHESDGIKYMGTATPNGTKRYEYQFMATDGNMIDIVYSAPPDYPFDHLPVIEKMVQTLEVL